MAVAINGDYILSSLHFSQYSANRHAFADSLIDEALVPIKRELFVTWHVTGRIITSSINLQHPHLSD